MIYITDFSYFCVIGTDCIGSYKFNVSNKNYLHVNTEYSTVLSSNYKIILHLVKYKISDVRIRGCCGRDHMVVDYLSNLCLSSLML